MAHHTAHVVWTRGDQPFTDNRYSRRHTIRFDGGAEITASASPHLVRVPMSDPAGVDPEEAFVASLSSCHMLWFLGIAARERILVDRYEDQAEGVLARNAAGKLMMTVVTLRPAVTWGGAHPPTRAKLEAMHHEAHAECFIANSVTTEVRCEPIVNSTDVQALGG